MKIATSNMYLENLSRGRKLSRRPDWRELCACNRVLSRVAQEAVTEIINRHGDSDTFAAQEIK